MGDGIPSVENKRSLLCLWLPVWKCDPARRMMGADMEVHTEKGDIQCSTIDNEQRERWANYEI